MINSRWQRATLRQDVMPTLKQKVRDTSSRSALLHPTLKRVLNNMG